MSKEKNRWLLPKPKNRECLKLKKQRDKIFHSTNNKNMMQKENKKFSKEPVTLEMNKEMMLKA